jgi:hypothetical protein
MTSHQPYRAPHICNVSGTARNRVMQDSLLPFDIGCRRQLEATHYGKWITSICEVEVIVDVLTDQHTFLKQREIPCISRLLGHGCLHYRANHSRSDGPPASHIVKIIKHHKFFDSTCVGTPPQQKPPIIFSPHNSQRN